MRKKAGIAESPGARDEMLLRILGVSAAAAAAALVVVLAVRPIGGHDIGYHLAYGEHFLDQGQIVQDNRFIYTRLDGKVLADPAKVGPGCRYDAATNSYRFVNVNWLSQVVLAWVCRRAGFVGLSILQAAMVAAIFAVLILAMRRCGVGWAWIAPAVVLAALTAHERFALRPELFGYLALAGQFALLVAPGMGWRRAAGVIALQVLAVNFHGYFLLGVALSGAMFAGEGLRRLQAKAVTGAEAGEFRHRMKWYGVAFGGAALACLCNPWFVRGAIMPIQTVLAIARGRTFTLTLGEGPRRQVVQLSELSSPFLRRWRGLLSTRAYFAAMGLAGAAAVAASARRRWGWALVLVGMAAASATMQRNIALAGIIAVPLSAMVLADGWRWLGGRLRPGRLHRLIRTAPLAAALATIAAAGFCIHAVVTHELYFSERSRGRFGLGMLEVSLPVAAADWIDAHRPAGRVFCDYTTSGNLMYFTRPHREVPILTNTWAYPPYVRQWVLDCASDPAALERAAAEYDVGTVVLNPSEIEQPLVRYLSASPDWALVEVDAKYVVFLRRKGNEAIARDQEITQAGLAAEVSRHIQRVAGTDPVPVHAIHTGAMILFWMDWLEPAQAMWEECTLRRPTFHEAVYFTGVCLGRRGLQKQQEWRQHVQEGDLAAAARAHNEAVGYLRRASQRVAEALRLKPDYREAQADYRIIQQRLAGLEGPSPPGTP